MARRNMHTVFDVMENKGIFEANVANPGSFDKTTGEIISKWPVQYPKMMYHPKGEEVITVPAEIVVTPMGPQRLGERRQLVGRKVASEAEEKVLAEAGWHDHPSKSIRARLEAQAREAGITLDESRIPDAGAGARMAQQEEMIRKLQADLADMRAKSLAEDRSSGKAVGVKQLGSTSVINKEVKIG